MSRARLALLGACALAAAAGCTSNPSTATGAQLRRPSAIAVFTGITVHDSANLVPYLAIANAERNDLTVVDVRSDTVVEAPLRLRPLAVPLPDRPALLASASLGDGQADLLVGVSAGDSVLQLLDTWTPANGIVEPESVDLVGEDIVAIAALPAQPAGEARLVLALAGGRLAVVSYQRSGPGIVKHPTVPPVVQDVGFQALALATVPGDGAHVYAATLDPIGPGAIHGVAEIDVGDPSGTVAWPVRALDARGPTRLVAAARLAERRRDAVDPGEAAFADQLPVPRVYAILDESGCGPSRRIDCGLVALDPDPANAPAAGDDHIPEDDWSRLDGVGVMPYRAPIRFGSLRPVAIAVAAPPAFRPADATYPDGYMRLQLDADSASVTTAVAVVATDPTATTGGELQFVDLGRFKIASSTPVPVAAKVSATLPSFVNTGTDAAPDETRLWLRGPAGFPETAEGGAATVGFTPGYTPSGRWTVTYQGVFPFLEDRAAEAGVEAPGADPWIAIQVGEGPVGAHLTSQVARLYHPVQGIAAGDIAVIRNLDAAGNEICTLSTPAGSTTAPKDFEVPIAGLLAPTADRPGGAVLLGPPAATEPPTAPGEWATCFANLRTAAQAAHASSALVPRLRVTLRSGGLLLLLDGQYAGRLVFDPRCFPGDPGYDPVTYCRADYDLTRAAAPNDEDALAGACPLADWDGAFDPLAPPPVCDTSTCRLACETAVLARRARRVHHVSESCETAPGITDATCDSRYAGQTFPFLDGPTVKFQVGVEVGTRGLAAPHREHTVTFSTQSGATVLADRPDGTTVQANGALAFDPSTAAQPSAAYRFFVSYPGNQVLDVTPSVSPISRTAIR